MAGRAIGMALLGGSAGLGVIGTLFPRGVPDSAPANVPRRLYPRLPPPRAPGVDAEPAGEGKVPGGAGQTKVATDFAAPFKNGGS